MLANFRRDHASGQGACESSTYRLSMHSRRVQGSLHITSSASSSCCTPPRMQLAFAGNVHYVCRYVPELVFIIEAKAANRTICRVNLLTTSHSIGSMKHGASIINLPPDLFALIVDQLLPVLEDGRRPDALDFACLRLSSRGMRQLCDASVRSLDLRHCSGDEMRQLLRQFKREIIFTGLRHLIRD